MNNSFTFFIRIILISFLPVLVHAQSVKVTTDYPSTYRAGEEFLMSVRVEKSSVSGTGRLQMEVPAGFTVKKVTTKGADFTFDNNTVKFMWVSLPDVEEFTVSYSLKADNKMRGRQVITGEFIYANGERTEHYQISPCEITLTDDKVTSSNKSQGSPKVDRKIVGTSDKKGEYKVELTIYPNNTNEQAQFIDVLPPDYSALVLDAHEASYSFENQSVIFTWKQFPKEKSFNISYLIRSSVPGTTPVINGTLVYGDAAEVTSPAVSQLPLQGNPAPVSEPGQLVPYDATPSDINSKGVNENEVTPVEKQNEPSQNEPSRNDLLQNKVTPGEVTPGEVDKNTIATEEATSSEIAQNTVKPVEAAENTVTPKDATQNNQLAVASSRSSVTSTDVSASTAGGILFRVQICATLHSSAKNSEWFEKKFNIAPPVELSSENGWKKYVIGNFSAYEDAAMLKNLTREKISDAFIVAYQNGKRIPVSDAIRNKQHNQ